MSIGPETKIFEWVNRVRKKQIQNFLGQKKAATPSSSSSSTPSLSISSHPHSFYFISSLRKSILQETSSFPPLPPLTPPFPCPLSLFQATQQKLQQLPLCSSSRLLSLSPSGFLSYATPHMIQRTREKMKNEEGTFLPDFVGVYASPAESLLSLSPPPEFIDIPFFFSSIGEEGMVGGVGGGGKPVYARGVRLYSVKKAMLLLLGGNHRLVEPLLFSPSTLSLSDSPLSSPSPQTAITTTAWDQIANIITPYVRTESLFRHYEGLITQNLKKVQQILRKKQGGKKGGGGGGGGGGELRSEEVREVARYLFHALRFFSLIPFPPFFPISHFYF